MVCFSHGATHASLPLDTSPPGRPDRHHLEERSPIADLVWAFPNTAVDVAGIPSGDDDLVVASPAHNNRHYRAPSASCRRAIAAKVHDVAARRREGPGAGGPGEIYRWAPKGRAMVMPFPGYGEIRPWR